MKIKPLLDKLTENWMAKAACIIIACLIYIFNSYLSLDQKSLPVSLEVQQDGEMVCTTHIPSSVSVTVRTSRNDVAEVSAAGIKTRLDLSYLTQEGTFDVPVFVDLPSSIIALDPLEVSVYPEKIKVHLEKKIVRTVKVAPQIVGTISNGYVLESARAEPEYISVYGPRSIVQSLNEIQTEGVSVDGRTEDFTQEAKLLSSNRLIRFYDTATTNIKVVFGYMQTTREIRRLPVVLKNLPTGFETASEFTASITVRGPGLILDEYVPITDTLSSDLSDIKAPGEYELPVSVLLPPELHLERLSPESVKVVVKERPPAVVVEEGDENDDGVVSGGGSDENGESGVQ